MTGRHAALARLDVLVGRWTIQVNVEGVGTAWTEFAWRDGGLFLHQYSDADLAPESPWRDHAPFPTTAIIGLNDTDEQFTMLYADARGVHRVYQMTFADGAWRIWRHAPGFNQRFTATISADGDTINGRWEMSEDATTWNLDFELTYIRQR